MSKIVNDTCGVTSGQYRRVHEWWTTGGRNKSCESTPKYLPHTCGTQSLSHYANSCLVICLLNGTVRCAQSAIVAFKRWEKMFSSPRYSVQPSSRQQRELNTEASRCHVPLSRLRPLKYLAPLLNTHIRELYGQKAHSWPPERTTCGRHLVTAQEGFNSNQTLQCHSSTTEP